MTDQRADTTTAIDLTALSDAESEKHALAESTVTGQTTEHVQTQGKE